MLPATLPVVLTSVKVVEGGAEGGGRRRSPACSIPDEYVTYLTTATCGMLLLLEMYDATRVSGVEEVCSFY